MYLIDGDLKSADVTTLRVRAMCDGTINLSMEGWLRSEFVEVVLAALKSASPSAECEGGQVITAAMAI